MDALTLHQFLVFVTTAEEGSFAAAARKLNRAQSAITYAVQKLEEQTGVVLFDRSGYRPMLTEAGAALFPRAKRIIDELEQYRIQSRDLARGLESRLALVMDPHVPSERLSKMLVEFNRAFPRVDIQVSTEPFGSAVRSLLERAAQIALFVELERLPEDLERTAWGTVEFVPAAGAQHPLAARKGKFDLPTLRAHTELVAEPERRAGDPAPAGRHWTISDAAIRRDLMLAGVGWGHMPRSTIADDLAAGRLVELDAEDEASRKRSRSFPVVVAHLKDEPLGPAARWLVTQFPTQQDGHQAVLPASEIRLGSPGDGGLASAS
jgi:DNA-binding transcriptional LysR family regulator